jgi:hypothetical protein
MEVLKMTTTKKRKSALNTTNLKAKAVKKTRVKKDNTPVHLRDSSYTQKKSFNDMKKISQDFLADRITDLTKVQKFVIPMTQHAVKLIMNFQKVHNRNLDYANVVQLIYKLSGYDKKQKINSFVSEVANVARRALLIAFHGAELTSKGETKINKEKIAIRDLHTKLKSLGAGGKNRNRENSKKNKTQKLDIMKMVEDFGKMLKSEQAKDIFASKENLDKLSELQNLIDSHQAEFMTAGENYIPKVLDNQSAQA